MVRFQNRTLLLLTLIFGLSISCYLHFNCQGCITYVELPLHRPKIETRRMLKEALATSQSVPRDHEVVDYWRSMSAGFSIHIDKRGEIETRDYSGLTGGGRPVCTTSQRERSRRGLDELTALLEMTLACDGNAGASILLTTDTSKWSTPEKQAVLDNLLDRLSGPMGHSYYVVTRAEQGIGKDNYFVKAVPLNEFPVCWR